MKADILISYLGKSEKFKSQRRDIDPKHIDEMFMQAFDVIEKSLVNIDFEFLPKLGEIISLPIKQGLYIHSVPDILSNPFNIDPNDPVWLFDKNKPEWTVEFEITFILNSLHTIVVDRSYKIENDLSAKAILTVEFI